MRRARHAMHAAARDARPTNRTNGKRFAEFIRARVQDEHPAWTLSKEWAQLTALGALLATLVDAYLLDRKYGLLSGGFLAPDHLATAWQRALYFVNSLIADAGFLGPIVALGLWVWGRHLRLSAATRGVLTLFVALAPIALTDFVSLHLVDYLGDIVNAKVLFELTGRSLAEVVAVAFGHLVRLVTAVGIAALVILAFGWFVNRAWPPSPLPEPQPPVRRFVLGGIVALVVAGGVATAAGRLGDAVVDAGFRRKPTTRWYSSLIQRISDVDRDGYGLLSRPPDPNAWDATVHPWAVEVPGNGIDEDGVGGDLPADAAPYTEGAGQPPSWIRKPPFVLAVLETFRGDLVGALDGGREVTPVLNGLGKRGVIVDQAFSHNGFTAQSRFHIFRGTIAGLRMTSLIDDFEANGYETAFMSAQDESFGGPALDVGFYRADKVYDARQDVARRFTQFSTPGSLGIPYYVLVERVQEFLQSRSKDRPLFLTVNFQETHFPYYHKGVKPLLNDVVVPRDAIGPDRAADLKRMYRNTAANVDLALGQVLDLVARYTGATPAVVALGDHGESLFDDGMLGHGYALDNQQLRIAMAIANLPARVPEPFGQSDLRDVIWLALSADDGRDDRPTLLPDPSRRVFQYIGTFERPAQIGFVTLNGRVSVHMVNLQARFDAGPWKDLSSLGPEEKRRCDEVIHFWERAKIARSRAGVPSE